jgi:hypothetical protein
MDHPIMFLATDELHQAASDAAASDALSLSAFIRQSIITELRKRGAWPTKPATRRELAEVDA